MLKVRSRLITLRVTDEEFETLTAAASLCGSRSLSEFARSRMLGPAHSPQVPGPGGLEGKLSSLDLRVAVLETRLAKILNAPVAPHLGESL